MSTSMQSGTCRPTNRAVAAQLAAATSSGRCPRLGRVEEPAVHAVDLHLARRETPRPARRARTPRPRAWSGTPGRARPSSSPRASPARRRARPRAGAASGRAPPESRCISSGADTARGRESRPSSISTRAALVFTPPMSQPSTAVRLRLVVGGPAWIEWVMQLIPVLDLAHGVAVQARAGDRARYEPVESVLTPGVDGRSARPHPSLPRHPGRPRVLRRRPRCDPGRRHPARPAPRSGALEAAPCGPAGGRRHQRRGRRARGAGPAARSRWSSVSRRFAPSTTSPPSSAAARPDARRLQPRPPARPPHAAPGQS